MEFFTNDNLQQFLTPVRPMVIDNQLIFYNIDAFGTSVLNAWSVMGKTASDIFMPLSNEFIKVSQTLGQFIWDILFPMDTFGFIFMILLIYVAIDSLMTDYQKNNVENKNMRIEIDDMRCKIDFYEAKHQSYDILVGELYENMNKMKRTIKKLEREMKKYD
jgi:peptidoglycan hydrolase CwlO-like protein